MSHYGGYKGHGGHAGHKGGKGNGKGGGKHHDRPWEPGRWTQAPYQPSAPRNPLIQMSQQFNDTIEGMKAFSRMARIGEALASQLGSAEDGMYPQPAPPPVQAPPPPQNHQHGQARELAEALAEVLNRGGAAGATPAEEHGVSGQHGDTRLKQVTRRLAEFIGVSGGTPAGGPTPAAPASSTTPGGDSFDESLGNSRAFRELASRVDGLSTDVADTRGRLAQLENVTKRTDSNVEDIKQILLRGRGGKPGDEGEAPTPAYLKPMFKAIVDETAHISAVPALGFTLARKECLAVQGKLPLDYSEWWAEVAKIRTESQWREKMNAISSGSLEPEATKVDVGVAMFRHMNILGAWTASPLQDAPP